MKVLQILTVVGALSLASGSPIHLHDDDHDDKHYKPKSYKFEYSVHDPKTGDIKDSKESSDGHTVKGYYKLKEADGTTRIVHYTADKHKGFTAHVEKIGHANHPEEYHHEPEHHYETKHYEPQSHEDDVIVTYDPEVKYHYTSEVIHHDDEDEDEPEYEPSEKVEVVDQKQESKLDHDFSVVHDKHDSTSYQTIVMEKKES